ncbi:MAG TPA: NAD-glutamate dehydrogenase [Actinomycetota bacterium]|nr:NAD-glutamate dehydrogenase [Actinomycetota bacterium]
MSVTDRGVRPEPATTAEALLERIALRFPDRTGLLRPFAQAYIRRLDPEELAEIPLDDLVGEVASAFAFADARGDRAVAVRAFNPTRDEHGYEPPGSVLETSTADSPFLFDSVAEELQARGLGIRRSVHPVVGFERGPDGRIARVLPVREAPSRESVMHFELDRRLSRAELDDLAEAVRRVLEDVRLAVRDFGAMREAVGRMIEVARAGAPLYGEEEIAETVAFLRWLLDDNFVFLGYREYELVDTPEGRALRVVPGSGLGILSKPGWSSYERPVPLARIEPNLRARIEGGDQLIYSKTNRPSTVHRRARMDYIGVRRVSPEGRVVGECRMVGLFTSKAYMEPASKTPLLGRKLRRILEAEDLYEGSHDYKAVVAIFESFPKDELFAASPEELRRQVMGLLHLQEQREVRLFVRRDLYGRSVSLLVGMPRDRFNSELRKRLQDLFVERFHGDGVDYHLSLGEGQLAALHFDVRVGEGRIPEVSFEELEREVVELCRTWEDRLLDRLLEVHGPERGRELFERWAPRFPDPYRASTPVDLALLDIDHLERLAPGDRSLLVGVVNRDHDGEVLTRIRLYRLGERIQLSEVVPILEDLGLRVVEEVPTHVHADGDDRFVHDFGVLGPEGRPLDAAAAGGRVAEAIRAVWRGEAESDSLNRLIVTAGLDHRQVTILRAYRKYHHRVRALFTSEYKNQAFAENPGVAAKLVRLFELRFDPARPWDPEAAARLRAEIVADLDAVRSLDQDRILRAHLGLIEATVRTNAYREGVDRLAFKFRSAEVPEMPEPRPLYEIFVYAPDVEAIHLRAGKVARGGIRWSDRRQDFRDEVLGLMKTQIVKNAVIVPTGAKGGFVLKAAPADPAERLAAARRAYARFMRGLLDLTDNLVDGKVVHPEGVRVHDEPDPYLVVAADKGTATFSDLANQVASEYGFWLGDAFASGGSTGYDHKALGITARGAWESVKRHFREIGTDPETSPITVVGIGDMSGDVFGNGMLLSDQICLVAAFDHRHIFIDPSPNPKVGYEERRRLFELPGSSWDDYDRSKISAGGGVWPRTAKRIPISPEARLALGLEEVEELTPNELIRAILRAPVDLLWNGGIGTFVKASTESHADVGDRANDDVRVDARELRCRVVAEGGNLGFTQRARIEYALAGGRINADFIDNSAGVDCSDHEVNLKILLDLAVRRGLLAPEERNALLHEVEPDVVRHVLYDNFLQAQILSQEAEGSADRMEAYEDLMQALEAEGALERDLWALPSTEEMAERRRAGRGMVRPELAVLLAYAKRSLAAALLASDLPDDPYLERDLHDYFPRPVVARFPDLVREHPLRRELIATIAANDVVNSMGITLVSRLSLETGAEPADVVRAYRVARDVTDAPRRWEAVEALVGSLEPAVVGTLMEGVDRLVEVVTRWELGRPGGPIGERVEAMREPFARLDAALPELAPEPWRTQRERAARRLEARGVPEDVARRHAFEPALVHAPNAIEVARATRRRVEDVLRALLVLGRELRIDWLEERVGGLSPGSRWERWAQQAAEDDLLLVRRRIAELALSAAPRDAGPDEAVARFLAARGRALARYERFMARLASEGAIGLAAATVALRKIRTLLA